MPRLLSLFIFDRAVYTRALFAAIVLLVSITTQAGTFTNVSTSLTAPATSSTGSYTVSFKTEAWGTHYLQEKKNSGSWANVKSYVTDENNWQTVKSRSVSRSGLATATYSYRVKFIATAHYPIRFFGSAPLYSNTKTVFVAITPGVPASISAPSTDNNGAFTVSWGTASGTVTSYKLQQQLNSGSWGQVYSGTSRSKAISGLGDGTYKYRVKACNSAGCSGYRTAGNTTVVTRPPGVPPAITITEL
ncbi:MAG: fibronectin type III domain-containing protein [Porticoccus sp.]|nr:fibronectin type III domain-containing protein [Porticoccus sp.]